ncbi:MAG: sulfurtransferase FdhD, partial [Bacteroidetes bacterium]
MPKPPHPASLYHTRVIELRQGRALRERVDCLAVEEPLEIQLTYGPPDERQTCSLSITMRTPGQDAELVTGFLFTEGIIGQAAQLIYVRHSDQAGTASAPRNVMQAALSPELVFDRAHFSRHFYTTSSCGVCGKASIDLVKTVSLFYPQAGHPTV